MRAAVRFAALAISVVVLWVGLTMFEVWRVGRTSSFDKADAIVVMGAAQYDGRPSPQLAARLDHALQLWKDGVAPVIVVTGGNQPGDRFTEADASRDYLVDRGVPTSAIVAEATSHSTWEAMSNLRRIADDGNLPIDDIVVVTDPFHSLRSRLIADEAGFDATTSSTRTGPIRGAKNFEKHLKEALGVALGRIIGFERLWKVTG